MDSGCFGSDNRIGWGGAFALPIDESASPFDTSFWDQTDFQEKQHFALDLAMIETVIGKSNLAEKVQVSF